MKSYQAKFESSQQKIVHMGGLQKLQTSKQSLKIPNPYKLSILGDI